MTKTRQKLFFLMCIAAGILAIVLASIFTQADKEFAQRKKKTTPPAGSSTSPAKSSTAPAKAD